MLINQTDKVLQNEQIKMIRELHSNQKMFETNVFLIIEFLPNFL
jgi:hypothetical protein